MATRDILRAHGRGVQDQEDRRQAATKQHNELKASILEERRGTDAERDLPELEGLVTKQHLRHARRVASAGKKIGATLSRLPVYKGSKPYHQHGHRVPKAIAFEAALLTLIERYGIEKAAEHFSNGQHRKYELKVSVRTGAFEFWNMVTGEREYPAMSPAEKLIYGMRESLRKIEAT